MKEVTLSVKKKIQKFFAFIGVIFIAILIIVILSLCKNQEKAKTYTKLERIKLISDGFKNGISKKELEELLNQNVADKTIMTGDDAYLLKTPNNDLIKKYNLENYVNENRKYFNNLEDKIKKNYLWKIDENATENQTTYFVTVKVYNYGIYLSDIEEMQNQLLKLSSNNIGNKEVSEYKSKVIAMKLLNTRLDDYFNDGEEKTVVITFTNIDDDGTKNSLMQYLLDLAGYTNMTEKILEMNNNRETRIAECIQEAFENNIIDQKDILELK